jgi:hypothetical protein
MELVQQYGLIKVELPWDSVMRACESLEIHDGFKKRLPLCPSKRCAQKDETDSCFENVFERVFRISIEQALATWISMHIKCEKKPPYNVTYIYNDIPAQAVADEKNWTIGFVSLQRVDAVDELFSAEL